MRIRATQKPGKGVWLKGVNLNRKINTRERKWKTHRRGGRALTYRRKNPEQQSKQLLRILCVCKQREIRKQRKEID